MLGWVWCRRMYVKGGVGGWVRCGVGTFQRCVGCLAVPLGIVY